MHKLYPWVSFNIIISFLPEKVLISSLIPKHCSVRWFGFFYFNFFEQKPLSQRKEFIKPDNLTLVWCLINFYFSCSISGNLECFAGRNRKWEHCEFCLKRKKVMKTNLIGEHCLHSEQNLFIQVSFNENYSACLLFCYSDGWIVWMLCRITGCHRAN